ncbi:MAG TPA: catechol 1,2-dioxygenase, partial [Pseudonocardiaceae bacterium]|nr:catechol 1,2-dioxygenase [Pseudonocardiaceae bacterium]
KEIIRRHQVTLPEFREAVGYIRNVVQDGELELLTAVLFEATVDEASINSLDGTASNVEGPFYVAGAPMLDGATPALPMRADEPGKQLTFSGTVRSTDGRPLASALVDVWQADDAGLYSQFAPEVPQWNLRGRVRTDEEGRFAFRSVVPAPYDIPGLPHTARLLDVLGLEPHRPAHVHLKIAAAGHRDLTTQVYFAGDPWLEQDVVGAAKPSLVTELRDVPGAERPARACTFDFVLAPADSG